MINTLVSIAQFFYKTRPLIMMTGVAFLALCIAAILGWFDLDSDKYLIPSLLGMCWSALFFILVSAFPYVPAKPTKESTLLHRLNIHFKRGLYYLMGLIFLALTIATVALSYKLLGIWQAEL